eukprot:9492431-Pyramimonas_sp.AAC.1
MRMRCVNRNACAHPATRVRHTAKEGGLEEIDGEGGRRREGEQVKRNNHGDMTEETSTQLPVVMEGSGGRTLTDGSGQVGGSGRVGG